MSIINNLKIKFRKHDFDLDNPEQLKCGNYKFSRFHCKNCDETLALDLWQMKELPWEMSHGCKGKKGE